jgi:transposase
VIKLEFTSADIEALADERYYHPHPQVQRKMEVLYLKSQGLSHQDILRLSGITSRTTLAQYLRQYQAGGFEGLKRLDYKGQPSALNPHIPSLKTYFEAHPPRTSAEAQAVIERMTGIKRSPTQIKAFLKRIGMSCRNVGYVPGKAATLRKLPNRTPFAPRHWSPV